MMPTITGSYTTAYAYVRDRGDAEVKAEATRALVREIMRGNKVRFSQTKDPVSEEVTITAALDLADGPPWTQTRQPQTLVEIFDQIEAGDAEGKYSLSDAARQVLASAAKPASRAPVDPNPPTAVVKEQAATEAFAKFTAALDAVEADLLPDTDAGFVVLLLRERLAELGKAK